jgi:ketoreductase RED1
MLRDKVVQLVEDTYGLNRYGHFTTTRDDRQRAVLDALAGLPLPEPCKQLTGHN